MSAQNFVTLEKLILFRFVKDKYVVNPKGTIGIWRYWMIKVSWIKHSNEFIAAKKYKLWLRQKTDSICAK